MSRHTATCKGFGMDDNCDKRCDVVQPIVACPVHDMYLPDPNGECCCRLKIQPYCNQPDQHPAGCDCGENHCVYPPDMCPNYQHREW